MYANLLSVSRGMRGKILISRAAIRGGACKHVDFNICKVIPLVNNRYLIQNLIMLVGKVCTLECLQIYQIQEMYGIEMKSRIDGENAGSYSLLPNATKLYIM